jgi:hypothetical protein
MNKGINLNLTLTSELNHGKTEKFLANNNNIPEYTPILEMSIFRMFELVYQSYLPEVDDGNSRVDSLN